MMASMGEMDGELDESVVPEHLRGPDAANYGDTSYLQFSYDKSCDNNWTSMLPRQKISVDENSPRAASHFSPESNNLPELASFDYGQRLPSLESNSSAPLGRSCTSITSSQAAFSWQPFGSHVTVHPHGPQASSVTSSASLHNTSGHLFPLVSASLGNAYATDFPHAHSPSNVGQGTAAAVAAAISLAGAPTPNDLPLESTDSGQFNQLTYAIATASGRLGPPRCGGRIPSPTGCDLKQIRMDLPGVQSTGVAASVTPIPTYAPPSAGSSNSQSSTPAHQGYAFTPNGSVQQSQHMNLGGGSSGLSGMHGYDECGKTGTFKQRSKKESHNRIERKRRDYINSQIVYLSSLLPPELYRDVDGRRNKGSVLRLSVNYIKELRDAVSRIAGLKQENTLARQLIPLLLKRIDALEHVVQEQGSGPLGGPMGIPSTSPLNSATFDTLYKSWLHVIEANQLAANNSQTIGQNNNNNNGCTMNPCGSGSEAHYFPDMMQTEGESGADMESGTPLARTSTGSSASSSATTASGSTNRIRMVAVKREQTDDRLAADPQTVGRVRSDSMRIPMVCGLRTEFGEMPAVATNRMDDEASPMTAAGVSFEQQQNLSYERYHRLMQSSCQPGVFGQNE